jgi:hypothetical protein
MFRCFFSLGRQRVGPLCAAMVVLFYCALDTWTNCREIEPIVTPPQPGGRRHVVGCVARGWRNRSHSARIYQAVVAALHAGVVLIAGNQEESVSLDREIGGQNTARYANPRNLPALVDRHRPGWIETGAGINEST